MYHVLFVCTANICRTPIAKYYLRSLIQQENLSHFIQVDSAGTWAKTGFPAAENSLTVCKLHGLDASTHVSQQIDATMMKSADIILCMSETHKRDLLAIFPQHKDKIFLLKEYARTDNHGNPTIPDPYGRKLYFYRMVYETIAGEIDRIFPVIRTNALAKIAEMRTKGNKSIRE